MTHLSDNAEFRRDYDALRGGAGLVDFSTRTQIELTGADRARFLHNFCTNAVRELAPGQGCEAFILDGKGRTLGHGFIFAGESSHIFETTPGQADSLIGHLERYTLSDDVQLHDRSTQWAELFLGGPLVETLLADQGLPTLNQPGDHAEATIAKHDVWLRRVDLLPPQGVLVACRRESLDEVLRGLLKAGAVECGHDAWESARIEHGTPLYGRDITSDNLPQEVGRDSQAISFTKGCYLGQETVARIDALGHVNRQLAGVRFAGREIPPPKTELNSPSADKPAGKITSSTWSPSLAAPLALAYLRREWCEPGTALASAVGDATVVSLPLET